MSKIRRMKIQQEGSGFESDDDIDDHESLPHAGDKCESACSSPEVLPCS